MNCFLYLSQKIIFGGMWHKNAPDLISGAMRQRSPEIQIKIRVKILQ